MQWLLLLFAVPSFLFVGFVGVALRAMTWFMPQVNPL